MWTRVGIQTEVNTMPRNIFFTDVIRGDPMTIPGFDVGKFSVWLSGWGTASGEAVYTVRGLLESFNPEAGSGNANWGRYTNARVDSLSRKARVTLDPAARLPLLVQATEIGLRDYALVPIHFQVNNWAYKATLTPSARQRADLRLGRDEALTGSGAASPEAAPSLPHPAPARGRPVRTRRAARAAIVRFHPPPRDGERVRHPRDDVPRLLRRQRDRQPDRHLRGAGVRPALPRRTGPAFGLDRPIWEQYFIFLRQRAARAISATRSSTACRRCR